MVLDSHTPSDKASPPPGTQIENQSASVGGNDQAAWNQGTAINTDHAQQLLGGLGLNQFRLETDGPSSPPVDNLRPQTRTLEQTRDSLTQAADTNLSPDQASAFKTHMEQFEQRAPKEHLSNEEIQTTYQASERLLAAATGATSVANMRLLAMQIMEEAANPNKALIGHSTSSCGPIELELLLYRNHPGAAANLVTQAAVTGKFTTTFGASVRADIKPTYESLHPDEQSQNYASQIFQSVALNAGLKASGDEGSFHLRYGKITDGNGAFYVDPEGHKINFDGTPPDLMLASYRAITGRNDLTLILSGDGESSENLKFVSSPEQMQQTVADLAAKNVLTVVLLDARNQPFWTQAHGYANGPPDPYGNYLHWIGLEGYDSNTGSITYHNGWDDDAHQISPKDLFRSVRPVDQNLPDMSNEFAQSLNDKNANYAEALESLRIRLETGRISDYDLKHLADRDIAGLTAQRGEHSLDDETTRFTILEIENYLYDKHSKQFAPNNQFRKAYRTWADAHPDNS